MSGKVLLDVHHTNLGDPVATSLLAQAADEEVLPLVGKLVATTPKYDGTLLTTMLAAIESRGLVQSSALDECLSKDSDWRKTGMGKWLTARLLETRGADSRALSVWDKLIETPSGPVHEAYLSRSRLHQQLDNIQSAFADLRRAVLGHDDYGFLARAARLFARLRRRSAPSAARKARIAVLSSTTTDLLVPLLQLACFRDGIDTELYVAPFGNFRQEILNAASGLYAFAPDFVLIATHWRDANLPPFSDTPDERIGRVVTEFRQLWDTLLRLRACRIIQHNFDLPGIDPYGHLSLSLPGGRGQMLREVNRQLLEVAPSSVVVLDLDQVSAKYGKQEWFDASYWHLAKQYPAANALPLLVDHQVALIRAGLGLTKKVLALDLDGTLWGGVIGEDGLEGIRLGPPSAVGEAYQALQQYAASLKDHGILLTVCSRNNEEDARLPFLHHDAMVLQLDDFAVFRANWLDKPANLREIANRLNLGIDSFVFLDDNPVERAFVRRELPEVAVPELDADPATFVAALERGLYFEALTLSQEDKERHRIYQVNVLREELRASKSLEDFLCSLEMEAETGPFDEVVLARVIQLIGKTNQFNLTTRRHSEEQVRRMMASGECWTQYFKLRDRFGDNGLVGGMIAHQVSADPLTWEIDTWLMSCRVIGRGMEQFMLHMLVEAAQRRAVQLIRGVYIPTAKNAMVSDLYPRLGFVKSEGAPHQGAYLLGLTAGPSLQCEFIRRENP